MQLGKHAIILITALCFLLSQLNRGGGTCCQAGWMPSIAAGVSAVHDCCVKKATAPIKQGCSGTAKAIACACCILLFDACKNEIDIVCVPVVSNLSIFAMAEIVRTNPPLLPPPKLTV
jgi:hypothetical protein